MDIDCYDGIERSADFKRFNFISKGPNGNLLKLVKFNSFSQFPDSHNLALGTIRGEITDYDETTNNNDRDKVLATVFHIARIFNQRYPEQKIFVKGRDKVTTRLYRGAINHGYKEISKEYFVYGGFYKEGTNRYNFELFDGKTYYDVFLFERRFGVR